MTRNIELFRYVYNWTINYQNHNYKEGNKFINNYDLFKIFSDFRNKEENYWLKELPVNTARHAIMKANDAFRFYFDGHNKKPKFKTKKSKKQYFTVRGDRVKFFDDVVKFDGCDPIKCGFIEEIPKSKNIKYYNCTIVFDGYDFWFTFSINLYYPIKYEPIIGSLGIDLGLHNIAVLSDGTKYTLPDTKKYKKRRNRQFGRIMRDYKKRVNRSKQAKTKLEDIPKSKNQLKREKEYRKSCDKIRNIRHTYIHSMTKEIVEKHPSRIVLETLNVKSMLKNKYLAKDISESMFYGIRTQISYKAKSRGIEVVYAASDFPSTQLCSNCGNKYKVGRSRVYKCPVCGLVIDRDLNAAINLSNYMA